jgi:hypothetical protein
LCRRCGWHGRRAWKEQETNDPERPQTQHDPSLVVLDFVEATSPPLQPGPIADPEPPPIVESIDGDETEDSRPALSASAVSGRRRIPSRTSRNQRRDEIIGAVAISGAVTFVALMFALASNCG